MEVVSSRPPGALPAPLETLKIGKPIGKGGFAVVHSGSMRTTEGAAFPVAIKVLHPEYSDETSPELRLFKEESELMLQMNHRNIITAYGLLKLPPNFPGLEGHTQSAYALVLEMMEGGSLARLMVKQVLAGAASKYTFSQALGWLIDVARALQYLHNGGKDGFPRIHRDVKLDNVLLTGGMRTAKLADFGLQRAVFAQHPEQHQQQAMLVRRSMRPSTTVPRGGPAGPSRLAPDSDRSSLRQGSAARLQPPASAGQERRSSPSGFFAAQQDYSGAADELLGGESLFYSVGNNGLTPLALPNSPQQQPPQVSPPPADAPEQLPESRLDVQQQTQAPAYRAEHLREAGIGRRSRSTSQLELLSSDQDPWPSALVAVASSARDGATDAAAAAQAQAESGGGMPGQLLNANGDGNQNGNTTNDTSALGGTNSISKYNSLMHRSISALTPRDSPALQVTIPPSPATPGSPGRRSLAMGQSSRRGPAGNSPSAARPSPLGPAPSGRRPNSLSEVVSQFDGSGLTQAQARMPASGSSLGAARAHDAGSPDAAPPPPPSPPPLFASASVPCRGVLTSSRSGVGEAARQSRTCTSLRDVVLDTGASVQLPKQDIQGQCGGGAGAEQSRAFASATNSMRPLGSTAPGAFSGTSGIAVATAAAASSCRLQLLAVADTGAGAAMPAGAGGNGGTVSVGAVLRPALSSGANSAVPRVAVDSASRLDYMGGAPFPAALAPRAETASGMLGGGTERERMSVGRFVGEVRSSSTRISVVTAAAAQRSSCRVGGDDALPPGAPMSPAGSAGSANPLHYHQHLQMADLLHMRLGAQNVSVRCVRASASGALNRQLTGSAPSSPKQSGRLAVVATATRAAAAGGGWQQETAAGLPASAARSVRDGSMPGSLPSGPAPSRGVKAAAPVADFEEVFSLTGRTGSLMYLAPEAYKNEPYNDKVDVYSLAILMYELFGRTSITYTHISTKLPAFSRMLCNADEFAERVAAGYRPPRTNQMSKMPPELWELIEASWHQDPVQRPDISIVLEALEELMEPMAEAEAGGGSRQRTSARCGCVIC